MPDPSSDPSLGSSSTPTGSPFGGDEPSSWDVEDETSMPEGLSGSLATEMARSWVQRHQKATMLGAFGVGVFIGVLLRD